MRGARPDRAALDAFIAHARSQPRPLPLVGHIRHDSALPGALYVGRKVGRIPASKYGNPYRMPEDGDRAAVIARYERWAHAQIAADPRWLDDARKASALLCWCRRVGQERPACHADVLVDLCYRADMIGGFFPPETRRPDDA